MLLLHQKSVKIGYIYLEKMEIFIVLFLYCMVKIHQHLPQSLYLVLNKVLPKSIQDFYKTTAVFISGPLPQYHPQHYRVCYIVKFRANLFHNPRCRRNLCIKFLTFCETHTNALCDLD